MQFFNILSSTLALALTVSPVFGAAVPASAAKCKKITVAYAQSSNTISAKGLQGLNASARAATGAEVDSFLRDTVCPAFTKCFAADNAFVHKANCLNLAANADISGSLTGQLDVDQINQLLNDEIASDSS